MSRLLSPALRTRLSIALCLGFAGAGCSVNAHFQAGTTAGNANGKAREARPSNSDETAARERTRRRRAHEDMERIDRESRERMAQAEHEAAEKERAAEAEAERDRQQAAADAEQRKHDAEAAAKADKAQKPMQRRAATNRFDMGTQNATGPGTDEVFERRNTEIAQSADEKKAAIRKRLEQNKSDILVAAERKRTAVQESLKDEPKP
jgi:Skp family chaperone for outer membrane proteins